MLLDAAGFGNRAAIVATTSADGIPVPTLAGEADVTKAEKTVRLVSSLARDAHCDIPGRMVFNRVRRTSLVEHAGLELEKARLVRLGASLSDLVACGEMSYFGQVPTSGTAVAKIATLLTELRSLKWALRPRASTQRRNDVEVPLKPGKPSPAAALAIATSAAPEQSPTRAAPDERDTPKTLILRVGTFTVQVLTEAAKAGGSP